MAYKRTHWVNKETKVNAANMNNIEEGIEEALDGVEEVKREVEELEPQHIEELEEEIAKEVEDRNSLITKENDQVFLNTGYGIELVLAEEFEEDATYYEAYVKITEETLTGTWLYKTDPQVAPEYLNRTFENDLARVTMTTEMRYVDRISNNTAYYYVYNHGQKQDADSGIIWWSSASTWMALQEMSFNAEDQEMYNWISRTHNKISDNYFTEEVYNLNLLHQYDLEHPSYRVIELTEETFVPNTYYKRIKTPKFVNTNKINVNEERINGLNELIKTDAEGNVFVNLGFTTSYILSSGVFDPNETYYESYINIDSNVLKGTWYRDRSKIKTGTANTSFTYGKAFTTNSNAYSVDYNSTINRYLLSIAPGNNTEYNKLTECNFDGSGQGTVAMWLGGVWNGGGILSFDEENANMLAFVKTAFTKVANSVATNSGTDTINTLIAQDEANPSYRIIALTEETYVANTYYVQRRTPTWVNIRTLVNE